MTRSFLSHQPDRGNDAVLGTVQSFVGPCREWVEAKTNICGAPAEYVLWGKLIPAEGLGPRCYDHAAEHVGHHALARRSGYALIRLDELSECIRADLGLPLDASALGGER